MPLFRRMLAAFGAFGIIGGAACVRSDPPRGRSNAVADTPVSMPNAGAGGPCRPVATAAELTAKAKTAMARVSPATLTMTPPLPSQWPEGGGGISFFAYLATPLPTGRIIYRVTGPLARVDFPTIGAAPVVVDLDPNAVLGEEERGERPRAGFQQRLDAAAEALVEVVAGCQPASAARPALGSYREWLAMNPLITQDLRARAGPFIAWLDTNVRSPESQ
jgi:hypothetical protein